MERQLTPSRPVCIAAVWGAYGIVTALIYQVAAAQGWTGVSWAAAGLLGLAVWAWTERG